MKIRFLVSPGNLTVSDRWRLEGDVNLTKKKIAQLFKFLRPTGTEQLLVNITEATDMSTSFRTTKRLLGHL